MDESWRMRMGMPTPKLPNYPPRRSTGNTASHHRKPISDDDPLNPEDFTDVFGGPPRTILSRQFVAGGNPPRSSSSSTGFSYRDIFRQPEKEDPESGGGRRLPQFNIPFGKQRSLSHADQRSGFYGDISRWDNHIDDGDRSLVRSRSRSKASSSSVLSSEELSPLRPAVSDDGYDDVYLFGSKLRNINVTPRSKSYRHEDNYRKPFADQSNICNISEIDFFGNTKNFAFGSSRRNTSPESINIEPMSSTSMSFRKSPDDMKFNSPCSPASSVCHSDIETTKMCNDEIVVDEQLDEDDDMMSSYVIEFDVGNKEWTTTSRDHHEPNGVDEAIAWAKEKFQTYKSSVDKPTQELVNSLQFCEENLQGNKKDKLDAQEETSKVQVLNEKIRLWSTGKEADIRLLLSSLHHILWDNSGWVPIPLTNIIETSKVKKAYQKAQLCLHPDKLQQRGATVVEKHIAEKVFSALQDAWAAFISKDALCSTKSEVPITRT